MLKQRPTASEGLVGGAVGQSSPGGGVLVLQRGGGIEAAVCLGLHEARMSRVQRACEE